VSWALFCLAIVLGLVLLWALGWSSGFGAIGSDGPAHAMTRDQCEGTDVVMILGGVGLAVFAAVKLIERAMNRDGWWQVGLWAGFLLIVDAVLMAQYVRFLLGVPCLD
jgi:hypothetical protein